MNGREELFFLVSIALESYAPLAMDKNNIIGPQAFITDFLLDSGVMVSSQYDCDGSKKCSAYCANCNKRKR